MNTTEPANGELSDEQILATALSYSSNEDSEEYWTAIKQLQVRISPNLLKQLQGKLLHGNENEKILAADVISQGRIQTKKFGLECSQILMEALDREESPRVIAAVANAVGHHRLTEAIPKLIKLADHADAGVRLAVVHGLLTQEDANAIATLIKLSSDNDFDIRNWATFGIGSMIEADSESIRAALLARIHEPDTEIVGEALVGLAQRGDVRVIEPLLNAINTMAKNLDNNPLLVEAMEAACVWTTKSNDAAWQKVKERCHELGLIKSNNG